MSWLVYAVIVVNLLSGFGALAAPFAVRRLKGPLAASLTSKLCMATALASAIGSIVLIRLAEIPGTGEYLIVIVPLTIIAGVTCVYWTVIGLAYASRGDLERTIKDRERRARTRRVIE